MLEAARAGATYGEVEAAGACGGRSGRGHPGVRELVEEVRIEVCWATGRGSSWCSIRWGDAGRADRRCDGPGAVRAGDAGDGPAAIRRAADRRADRPQHIDPRRPGVVALPVRSRQPRLIFDRDAARGFRLDIPAGATERWAPGETRTVRLVRFARRRTDATTRDDPPLPGRSPRPLRPDAPATASASPTPTSGSASPRIARRPATSRSGATPRPSGPDAAQGRPSPSELDVVIVGALVVDPLDRRRQGRHRHQGRPDRRRRAGGQRRRSATASSCRSGRTPSRSWATA